MATFEQFINSIQLGGNDGKAFEIFVKWFLMNDPEWSTQVEDVWLWDEWPDKWGPDTGIDLIFQHKNGDIWAIQAKCYDSKYPVSKKDMDTFLSESSRSVIKSRLLVTSTDLMSANAIRTCKHQEKPVVRYMLSDFENAAIDYPPRISDLNTARRKPKPTPRPHQQKAIEDVSVGFADNDRGQMIMACGTGKTFTSLWVKERLEAHSTLVLLPSLSLLSQTLREWTAASQTPFDVLCVCSDQSVGRKSLDEAEDMSICEFSFPVSSDPGGIKNFLQSTDPKVVFCTYQSSELIEMAQTDHAVAPFDLIVADEAHRCAGNSAGDFSVVLDGERIRASKILFTTATPRTYTTHLAKNAADRGIEIVGMDDPVVFGPELHHLTFGQAIHNDPPLLTDYQVVIVGVDQPMIAQWIEEGKLVATKPDMAMDARSLAAKIGLIKAIKDYDLKRVISFHNRVNSAKLFSEELEDLIDFVQPEHRPDGAIWSDFVSGEMSAGDRSTKIKKLKVLGSHDRGLLTNARCLSEGVDVPALDGVAFIDPRGSQVDIIQAVGRAIRLSDSKEVGTIVLPVFIEDGNDAESSIEASNFKPVWDVLKALRSHDEVLAETLDQFRTNMAKISGTGDQGSVPKVVFDLPVNVDPSFAGVLRTVLVEKSTASWNFWFGLLEDYVSKHGDARVQARFKIDGFALGAWVSNQRKHQDYLTLERQEKLERLGFVWDPFAADWEEAFGYLEQYVSLHGNARVHQDFKIDGFAVGSWVSNQRKNKDKLTTEQREKLDRLGFVWGVFAAGWDEGFEHLEKYVSQHGNARVHAHLKIDGFAVGSWVSNQRKNKDKLTTEQREKLDRLVFVWDVYAAYWEEGFEYLEQYVQEHGNARVHVHSKIDSFAVGTWVNTQRINKDKLTTEQREKLDRLGFVWDPLTTNWDEGFEHLEQYVSRHSNARVPARFKIDGFALGTWVSRQRKNKNKLTPEWVEKLERLGFVWDPIAADWEEGFGYLEQYVQEHGNARVHAHLKIGDFSLGNWVSNQRKNKDALAPERRDRLDRLGFVWDVYAADWNEGFAYLEQYVANHNNARVPYSDEIDGYSLGLWVSRQRRNKAALTPERLEKLEALLGWVWSGK